uniref:Forkhead-associated domain-containing protein 1-like protein n=2 Tax=Callorhinchus milii TaxID=7868 RepID=V9KFU7_CALMI
MKESRKINDEVKVRESELVTLRHTVEELKAEVQVYRGELESVNTLRAEEKRIQEWQRQELVTSRQQLQATERGERLLRVQLQQTQARLERFRSRIIQTTYCAPGVPAPRELLTDQQVLEQMKQIIAERSEFQEALQQIRHQRECEECEGQEREERECWERQEYEEQEREDRKREGRERRELEELECREQEERNTSVERLRSALEESQNRVDQMPSSAEEVEEPCKHSLEEKTRMELAEAGDRLRTQQDVIEGLRRLLVTANASMSDLAGELSEKQKEELEEQRRLSELQAQALSSLRKQLARTARLLGEKEQELQEVNMRLRKREESLEEVRQAVGEKAAECRNLQDALSQGQSPLKQLHTNTEEPLASELSVLGLECKGRRHEEVIQRQRAALAELRSRMTSVEQTCAARDPQEKERGAGAGSPPSWGHSGEARGNQENLRLASVTISEASIERTLRLEMSEALDLSEMTYLDMVKVLSKVLNMTELSRSLSMKHIPRDEREKLGTQRRRDLEMLSSQISQLQTQLERKEELLQAYEKDLEQLRQQQVVVHTQRYEVERLQTELQRQIEENGLIRESLRQAQARLDQEKRLNKAIKQRKTFHLEQLEKQGTKLVYHTCVQDVFGQAPAKQKAMEEKLKRKGYEIEKLKNELRKQDQELCHTTSQLVNLQLASRMIGRQNPEE